jgi:RNA polymerase sigma-54 factor
MRFDASQQMRMSQQMKLAPQMIQSMEILQMSLAELEERIERELESNATLESGPAEGEASVQPQETPVEERPLTVDERSGVADFERLESYERANPEAAENIFEEDGRPPRREPFERGEGVGGGDSEAKFEAMANTADRPASVHEQLREQWTMAEVEGPIRELGEVIVGYIEEDGYLRTSLETIAERLPPGPDGRRPGPAELERALKAVQLMLEPPGIGARDTRECLLLQIDARLEEGADPQRWALARRIVEDHLTDLSHNRLPRIAQKLGVGIEEVNGAVDLLRTLSLAPGRRLARRTEPGIIPDAIVEYDAETDRYIVYMNDARLPNLRVNQEYARLARDRSTPKPTRDFIRTSLANAHFLLDAIEQRRRTLLRVIEAVVAAQRDYFDYGPQHLKPLPMTKVAEQLGIHVATVSRAVADKYIQTPRGVVPLRRFFTGGTTSGDGEEVSWEAIKAALQEIVAAEDKRHPLSDDQLAEELEKRGLKIARRTVAKYRGQLGIPTGRLRKAH